MNKYPQKPQAELDLHLMSKTQAEEEVYAFLEEAEDSGYDKIRIITGKGLHSENGVGILNAHIKNILDEAGYRYSSAKHNEGGNGAIDVIL